jgi:hypothetical protein
MIMDQTRFRLNSKALLGMMVLAAAGAMPVHAATIAADPTAVDGVAGDTKCSLREAVIQINTGIDSGDCKNTSADAYGTNDTITLAAGTYNLTVTGLDEDYSGTGTPEDPYLVVNQPDAAKGDIDLMKSVRIAGAGADTTIIQWDAGVSAVDTGDPATNRDRIFHVFTTVVGAVVDVAIEGVTIQGGRTFEEFIADGPVMSNPLVPTQYYLRRAGGGLAVGPAANVVQIDPALTGDENAEGRGGSQRPLEPDEGGATFSIKLTGVKVLSNVAQGDGAGIYTASPMTATGVVVSGNVTTITGGGLYHEGDRAITHTTISDNTAEGGGGIFMTGSNTVSISGTTLSGNRAVGGGAISGRSGMTLNLVNSTLSGNIGSDVGAGLYTNGSANLNFVTIANNLAGADSPTAGSGINVFPASTTANTVTLKNVLLSGNKVAWLEGMDEAAIAALESAKWGVTGSGIPGTTLGNNLSSDASCDVWLTAATDKKSVDPKLGVLAANGGPTLTHALPADSPALSSGAADPAVTVDQRGVTRQNPPDIGAYEFVPVSTGGGGGGCAVGSAGRLDPTLPAMLAAALAFFGLRRRAAK